jgi:hypothetical protein
MSKSTLRWLIIIATVVTAIVHLALGLGGIFGGSPGGLDYIFVLNGLGYFALLAAVFVPNVPFFAGKRALAHYLLIGFAAVTFILYFVFNGFSSFGPAAIVSKLAELVIIVTTFMHLNQA